MWGSQMEHRFKEIIGSLDRSYKELIKMQPVTARTLPRVMPKAGVYLFSEGDQHLYVGRSNDIRGRIGRHSRPGATYRMAAFAFRLAREKTGKTQATYRKKASRAQLMEDPSFRAAFDEAKARIRKMEVQFAEESDPTRQALLELYVAIVLATKYNDFDNH